MYWIFTEGSGEKTLNENSEAYIIEVLTGFHYVWGPFCLINLHPALAQELS